MTAPYGLPPARTLLDDAAPPPPPPAVDTVEDIDAAWMTEALRRHGLQVAVRSVLAQPLGTGQMGSCFRLNIDYATGEGPTRLIAKLPASDSVSRAAGSLGYRCESGFYQHLAGRITTRVPHCWLSVTDPANNGFTLLLEDLAPAEPGDQITGCTPEQARAAAVNIAGLHASTWNDPALGDFDWLIPDLTAMPDFTAALLTNATEQFLRRYTVAPVTAAILQQFAQHFARWATGRALPFSLLHSDYRLDNLLFAPTGDDDPVIAVDWQVVTIGAPLRDVALLLTTGLSVDDRRAHERRIVESYYDRVTHLGVTHYGSRQCWDDYRHALFQAPFITVLGALVAQATGRGDRMFTVMADRAATAIQDHNALDLLSP